MVCGGSSRGGGGGGGSNDGFAMDDDHFARFEILLKVRLIHIDTYMINCMNVCFVCAIEYCVFMPLSFPNQPTLGSISLNFFSLLY